MADNEEARKRVYSILEINDTKECNQVYNKWAESYQNDMDLLSYIGPKALVEQFDDMNVPKDAKILDLGAGAGGVGRELVKKGYTNLHALDGSQAMLDKAKEEGNYKTYKSFLIKPNSELPFEDEEFDCVTMAGVFVPGHFPIGVLYETARVTKKGGSICFSMCDPSHYADKDPQFKDDAFPKLIDDMKENGLIKEKPGFPRTVTYIEYSPGIVHAYDRL